MGITAINSIPTGKEVTLYREGAYKYETCVFVRPCGKRKSLVTNANGRIEQVHNANINDDL